MRGNSVADIVDYEVPCCNLVFKMLLGQAKKIRNLHFAPDVVVGIARGGVVPARFLADLLEADFATLQVEFYVGIGQTKVMPKLKHALTIDVAGKAVLLVDDIADSGKTLQLAITHLEKMGAAQVRTATLYHKPQSIVTPDFFEKQTLCWVVFPWDLKETLRKILATQTGRRPLNQEIAKLVKAGLPKSLAEQLLKDMQ